MFQKSRNAKTFYFYLLRPVYICDQNTHSIYALTYTLSSSAYNNAFFVDVH